MNKRYKKKRSSPKAKYFTVIFKFKKIICVINQPAFKQAATDLKKLV